MIGHLIDPSRYPNTSLDIATVWMSLHYEDQFVPSNLSVSEKLAVITNILVYENLLSTGSTT